MRFNIEEYRNTYDAMICGTVDEAIRFQNYLDSVGKTWNNGRSYTETVPDNLGEKIICGGGVAYCFNAGQYGSFDVWLMDYCSRNAAVFYINFDWDDTEIQDVPDLDELFDSLSGEDKHEDTF